MSAKVIDLDEYRKGKEDEEKLRRLRSQGLADDYNPLAPRPTDEIYLTPEEWYELFGLIPE